VCNDNNKCTDDSCQDVGGEAQCVYVPKTCNAINACNDQKCDTSTGEYEWTLCILT
jgi:hypothetical protein